MPRLAARIAVADRRVRAQAILPHPSGPCFQTCWFLHLPLRNSHKTVPEPFSYLARRCLHARDHRRLHSLHRRGTCLVNRNCPRGWTSDLFSFQLRPELEGVLWRAAYAPGDGQTSPAYSSNPVQYLYISCYVIANNQCCRTTYLLLHLLSQFRI
jgi:hypothetical protein